MKFEIIWLSCVILLYSCSKLDKEILIDNPSDKAILCQFDDESIQQIGAGNSISKLLETGLRTLQVNGADTKEIKIDKDKEYLLNPLLATYYIEEIELFASEAARTQYLKYTNDREELFSIVEGIKIPGKYEMTNDLLIEKTWEYGLNDDPRMKTGIRSTVKKDRYVLYKIHRRNDLIKLLQNDFNEEVKMKFRAPKI